MKIDVQSFPEAWRASTNLAASGSTTSGSFVTSGYARIVGVVISSASAKAGSGLRISQSVDSGGHWDYYTDFAPSACSGSAFSIEIVGNAGKIDFYNGNDAADEFRTLWQARPV